MMIHSLCGKCAISGSSRHLGDAGGLQQQNAWRQSADGQGAGPNVSNKTLSCKGSTEQGPTSATKDSAAEAADGHGAGPNFNIMLPGQQATASSQPTLRRRPASCSQRGIATITDLTPTQRRVSDRVCFNNPPSPPVLIHLAPPSPQA